MKYLRIIAEQTGPTGSYGILKGDRIHLLDCSPFSGPVKETGVAVLPSEVKSFLPPVDPSNIIALGLNYVEHAREGKWDLPPAPVIFLKATTSLAGHLSPIILPAEAPLEVDYEAELTIVIGKAAKNVPEEKALDYVLGYTCGNDVSARDCQLKTDKQWARGKSFDTFAPIGPVIETELDPSALTVQSRLNGKIMQDGNTRDIIFKIPAVVSYLSRQMTLLPRTLIMTGTPPGVGFARKPQVFLKPGDIIEVEIEGIGTLINPVIMEK
ncbi:MAG: fumarylacetoacetate hydrolase family protein [Candidatus Ratteibacteria bacterium]|jgi:2-keto-4-pentenoate hydratase/2-oxohepta-3-ene-1,7-dioic acid hydratase in catechol pathway